MMGPNKPTNDLQGAQEAWDRMVREAAKIQIIPPDTSNVAGKAASAPQPSHPASDLDAVWKATQDISRGG